MRARAALRSFGRRVADRSGRVARATYSVVWAGLSIPKSRRAGEDVAVVGLNFDLLAGRDVFLATDD